MPNELDNRTPQNIQVAGLWVSVDVRLASTQHVFLAAVPPNIDSVPLGPQVDRVLLTGQSPASQNGLYELTGGGSVTGYNFAPEYSGFLTGFNPARIFKVVCTGGAVVYGANLGVAGPDSGETLPSEGFIAPGPLGDFVVVTGVSGGTVTIYSTTTLVRIPEADTDAEIIQIRRVQVAEGASGGEWKLEPPASATPITSASPIVYSRVAPLPQAGTIDPFASATNSQPGQLTLSNAVSDDAVGMIVPSADRSDIPPSYTPLGLVAPVSAALQQVTVQNAPVQIRI